MKEGERALMPLSLGAASLKPVKANVVTLIKRASDAGRQTIRRHGENGNNVSCAMRHPCLTLNRHESLPLTCADAHHPAIKRSGQGGNLSLGSLLAEEI